LFEGAFPFADAGPENVPAVPPDRLFLLNPGDSFGGPIKGCNAPLPVNGENPVGYAVEDYFGVMGAMSGGHFHIQSPV
jgi:hypothetical protein